MCGLNNISPFFKENKIKNSQKCLSDGLRFKREYLLGFMLSLACFFECYFLHSHTLTNLLFSPCLLTAPLCTYNVRL